MKVVVSINEQFSEIKLKVTVMANEVTTQVIPFATSTEDCVCLGFDSTE